MMCSWFAAWDGNDKEKGLKQVQKISQRGEPDRLADDKEATFDDQYLGMI